MEQTRVMKTLSHTASRGRILPVFLTLITIVFLSTFTGSVLWAADPHSAYYSAANDKVFWFIHITDPHIGTSGSDDTDNLQWIVTEARTAINPLFIVNSGDLTDSTKGDGLFPDGPHIEEWEEYYGILDAAGIDADFYYDIPGNHDHYNDKDFVYYLANSIQGIATGQTQISWRRDFTFGKYHFIGVCTAGNDGASFLAPPNFGDHAGLDEYELSYIETELENNTDADLTIIFGHHPILSTGNPDETSLTYGAAAFIDLMESYGVSMYAFGHTHRYEEDFLSGDTSDGILYLNVGALGKSDENQYNVTAIDCNGISTVAVNVKTWPVVLITAPVDRNLGTDDSPYAYSIDDLNPKPIRALVFDVNPVTQVRFRIDETGDWHTMTQVTGNSYLWEALFDNASTLSEENHTLEVQATGSSTRSDIIVIGGNVSNDSSGESGGGGCFISTAGH